MSFNWLFIGWFISQTVCRSTMREELVLYILLKNHLKYYSAQVSYIYIYIHNKKTKLDFIKGTKTNYICVFHWYFVVPDWQKERSCLLIQWSHYQLVYV